MVKEALPSSSAGRRHGVLPTYSLAARLAQGLTNEQATSSLVNKRSNRQIYKMIEVKQEEADTRSDMSGGQITLDEPLCRKHNKPYEYIHCSRKASSIEKLRGKKIHLKPGNYILRGEPCIHYVDEFSRHVVWGNTVKLYNHNVRKLPKIIRSTGTPDRYYVCHMTETFAIDGKRMYFSVPFSMGSLFPHMDADRGELPITAGDGNTAVTARFIKGVDKRATITKGCRNFFRQAHMNKGQAYAFAFNCTSKGLRLIFYSI